MRDLADGARRLFGRAHPYGLPLLLAAVVGAICVSRILDRAGELAMPLDDSYIHLQYARRLSEGHFFRYVEGAGYSSGATSLIWPVLLAPWFWLGAGELFPIAVTWVLGWLIHGALALETGRLAVPLTGRTAGLAASATVLVFGAFAWFAYSGMETLALAWVLTRGARVAAERWEGRRSWSAASRPPSDGQLAALGLVAPLIRPEGALVSLFAAGVGLALWRRDRLGPRAVALSLVPAIGPTLGPLSHWLHTGRGVSSTAVVKWLALDPYLETSGFVDATLDNAHLLVTDLLAGGDWTRIFLPEHTVWFVGAGLVALIALARRQRLGVRATLIAAFVLATLVPTTYATMLWNRVRYIWPFAPGWIVAVACLWAGLGELAATWRPLARIVTPVLAWGSVAFVGAKLDWATQDLATSARAIRLQQAHLGRWARAALPPDAVIGVNDTGAIAYFSHRRTFDVVGLTTPGEAPYWAHGAGSRFEHYERLPLEALPTFFIVYSHWMAMEEVLGPKLTEATVVDQTILGGRTMGGYEARWDRLHSGARPVARPAALPVGDAKSQLADELDVADVISEQAHAFALGEEAAARHDVVGSAKLTDGRTVVDGGRRERLEDRFTLAGGPAATLVLRLTGEGPFVVFDGQGQLGETKALPAGDTTEWREHAVALPASEGPRHLVVRSSDGQRFASWHYWLYEPD